MKVLLTGATGFLGSHLLESFIGKKYDVVILKRTTSNLWRIKDYANKFKSYDIDKDNIDDIFEAEKPEIVVHTACSYARRGESIEKLLETNLIFAIKIFEASLKNNVETFINSDSLLPRTINNYSLSKAQFSDWLQKYSDLISIVNFKIEHMFGTKDDDTKFLGWLIKKMLSSNEKIDLTSGIQKRDFIYIDDIISAFNLVIDKRNDFKGWNEYDLGTGVFTKVRYFVESIAKEIEKQRKINVKNRLNFGVIPYRNGEIMRPILDITKLKNLGWQPKVTLEKGIKKTVAYYL